MGAPQSLYRIMIATSQMMHDRTMRDGRDCNRYIQIEHTYVIHPTTLSIFFLPRISQYSPVHPQKHSHWPAMQTPPTSEHVTLPTEQSDEKQHNTEGYCSVSVSVGKEYLYKAVKTIRKYVS